MQQRQNKIIFISFSFISLLMIALRDSVVQQVIVLVIGIFILILVNRLLDKEVLKELETKNLEIEKKAKKKTDEATRKLNNIIETIPSSLVYINQKGEFDVYNKKFMSVLKVDAENVYDGRIESPLRETLMDAF